MVKLLKSWPKNERRLKILQFGDIFDYYRTKFPLKQPIPEFKELTAESKRLIEGALGAVAFETSEGYHYSPGIEATAAYLYFVNKSHFLFNGNKRASLAAALGYLRLHNHFIETNWPNLYKIAERVAISSSRKSVWPELINFLSKAIVIFEPSLLSQFYESINNWAITNKEVF